MSISNRPELIGIAGTFASGKDLIAHYLSEHYGYTHPSTSELVRNIAMKERGSIERPVLYEIAQAYREKHGAGVFVDMLLNSPRPTVISGLRSVGEAKSIKAAGGIIVFVDAPPELRYERMRRRDRDAETQITLEEFKERERLEWHVGDKDSDFSFKRIKNMADIVLDSSPERDVYIKAALRALNITR